MGDCNVVWKDLICEGVEMPGLWVIDGAGAQYSLDDVFRADIEPWSQMPDPVSDGYTDGRCTMTDLRRGLDVRILTFEPLPAVVVAFRAVQPQFGTEGLYPVAHAHRVVKAFTWREGMGVRQSGFPDCVLEDVTYPGNWTTKPEVPLHAYWFYTEGPGGLPAQCWPLSAPVEGRDEEFILRVYQTEGEL